MRASMAVKRQRWEVKQKESFVQHMSHRFASKTVEKDLHTSQKACYQLDSESVSVLAKSGFPACKVKVLNFVLYVVYI